MKIWISILILIAWFQIASCLYEALFFRIEGKYFANNVMRTGKTRSELECGASCSRESYCVSVNYKMSGENQGKCELNNKTWEQSKGNIQHIPEFTYLEIVERTCKGTDHFSQETKKCFVGNSCKFLLENDSSLSNGEYNINVNSLAKQYPVYCHMTDIPGCGGGGWTLVMKLDGKKSTFNYSSRYWNDKNAYNILEGLEGLTDKETKLESYWNTPFSKICLGMKVSGVTKWIKVQYEAPSFYDIIADGTFRRTFATRDTWKSLIDSSSLQLKCSKEGFNVQNTGFPDGQSLQIRVGLAANDENDCDTCDTWIGFGVTFNRHYNQLSNITTGNVAFKNGIRDTPAFGYVLVS